MPILSCRVCASSDLEEVADFGNLYVSDFPDREDVWHELPKAPLTLVRCGRCTLVQLAHTYPQDLLYTLHYWYRSGITGTMNTQLCEVVEAALRHVEHVEPDDNDVWLDIGANDGTLLAYVPDEFVRVGCEPAINLLPYLEGQADYIIGDFWDWSLYDEQAHPPAKVVTAIGMFYDLDDPNTFISDIQQVLAPDGVFVSQLMTLAPMLHNNDIGNVCHEHLEYYSYESLRQLFERNGLEIFDVEYNDTNGGSYRLFARHYRYGSIDYPERATDADAIQRWKERVDAHKRATQRLVESRRRAGDRIWVYGASTKGNTILQYYGLNYELIDAAADKSPEKVGRYMVGSWVPIKSEREFRERAPDYALVLPYAFRDEFIEREQEWLANGGKFVFSIPQFEVVR